MQCIRKVTSHESQSGSRKFNPGYAPVICSKLLLTYLPFHRFWKSTLIDLGDPRKRLYGHQNYHPSPWYAYFRACLKKLGGPPFTDFSAPPPPKVCTPPPGKIPAGAHACHMLE